MKTLRFDDLTFAKLREKLNILSYANILSTIALLVSAGAFIVSYIQYSNSFENSEIKWKIASLSIKHHETESKIEISSDIDIAITNNSNSPLYLSACNFEINNAFPGRGGLETLWISCPNFERELEDKGEVTVAAGQTKFFKDKFLLIQNTSDVGETLEELGIHPTEDTGSIFTVFSEKFCEASFTVRVEGGNYSSNCRIRSNAKLFSISIQTGSGKYIGGDIRYGFQDDWPWAWSRF